MRINNKKSGTAFEDNFRYRLSQKGFWAHKMQDNRNGQPFDIIAAKNGETYVLDCKECKNDTFPLSRIEENQYNAMMLWQECGNSEGMFAIKCSKGIRIMQLSALMFLKAKGIKVINKNDLLWYSKSLKKWLEEVNQAESNHKQ